MGERHSSIRGLFAVTESGDKHAPCRLPINAVADDRSFVAFQTSGSDDLGQYAFGVEEPAPVLPEVVRTGIEISNAWCFWTVLGEQR